MKDPKSLPNCVQIMDTMLETLKSFYTSAGRGIALQFLVSKKFFFQELLFTIVAYLPIEKNEPSQAEMGLIIKWLH